MCSLNDVDGNCESLVSAEKPSFNENTTCRSCARRGLVVLRKKDVYCRDCFLSTETHKFRAALGKSKMMKPNDKVLVAYSGSQSSAALLHLLHSGLTEEQHKKLLFSVQFVYIEDGALLRLDVESRNQRIDKIIFYIEENYNFFCHFIHLENFFQLSYKHRRILDNGPNEEREKKLIDLFDSVKSYTSKEDLLNILRQKLILRAAEELNCNKIFTAEVGTDLAVKLLSVFSLGRGGTAAFETGFCDPRHQHIKIIRPLRDFTRKEIAFYNKFHNIKTDSLPSLTTKSVSNISIKKLTEKFVNDLQEGFPSTVYTIFRTGEKLSSSTLDEEVSDAICLLCKDKLRTHKSRGSYTAVEAAGFSRNVSRKKLDNCAGKQNGSCSGSCSECPKIDKLVLEKYLCYGCTLIVRDMKNINTLPEDVLESAIQKRDFDSMKEQISEFLIENSSEVEV